VTKALEYAKELNAEQSETKVTVTHVMAIGLAWSLYKIRKYMGRSTFGFFRHDKKIGTTVLVDVDGGADLVPITIFDAHKLSVVEFAKQCNEKVSRAKNK
jgi:hypothetical protein